MNRTQNQPVTVGDVKAYYDRFSDSRMAHYRKGDNPRINLAIGLAGSLLRPGFRVADIGCGIGLVTQALARRDPSVRVVGTDLSERNIAQAREVVTQPNAELFQSDVRTQEDALRTRAPNGYDLMVLVDVIEHIPEDDRPELLAMLARLATPEGSLVLTYPSADYIEWLEQHDPDELQIIDNAIPPETLIGEADEAGWRLRSLAYKDIWRKNQYVHAVFCRSRSLDCLPVPSGPVFARVIRRIRRLLTR